MADADTSKVTPLAAGTQRLDKWLWFARILKSRTLAAKLVEEGKIRVNRERVDKPAHQIKPGDVLTASVHTKVIILKVLSPGARRGPAKEAAMLYEDLTPPPPPPSEAVKRDAARDPGSGRPTKRERRQTDRFKGGE